MSIEVVNAQAPQIGPALAPDLVAGEAIKTNELRRTPRGIERWRLATGNTEATYTPSSWVRVATVPGVAPGAVCFVGDDLYSEHSAVLGLIKARGGHGTIAYLSASLNDAGRLSTAQVQALAADGHEMAWHSTTHQDMTALSAASRASEWDGCIGQITTVTGKAPTSAVYPVSARTDAIDHEAYARGISRVFYGVNGLQLVDRTKPIPFAVGRISLTPARMDQARESIKIAAREGKVAVIYIHQNDAAGNVTTANLTELFDLCVSQGVPMTTLAEAFPAHQPIRNLKMDLGASSMYELTLVGGATIAGDSSASSQPPGFSYATQGIRALKFVNTADTDDGLAALGISDSGTSVPEGVAVKGGEPFAMPTFLSFTRTSGSGSARLEADELDANGAVIRTDILDSYAASTSGFVRAGTTAVITDRRCVRVRPRLRLSLVTGTAYFFAPHPGHALEVGATPPLPAAGAATASTSSYGAPEAAMLQKAYDALRSNGLLA